MQKHLLCADQVTKDNRGRGRRLAMGRPLVTVCVLCLLCATHAQCAGSHGRPDQAEAAAPGAPGGGGPPGPSSQAQSRTAGALCSAEPEAAALSAPEEEDGEGDGEEAADQRLQGPALGRLLALSGAPPLGPDGLRRLMQASPNAPPAPAHRLLANASKPPDKAGPEPQSSESLRCLGAAELLAEYGVGPAGSGPADAAHLLARVCPLLLARALAPAPAEAAAAEGAEPCVVVRPAPPPTEAMPTQQPQGAGVKVWLCATGSILVVSMCGLLGVAVIPFMQRLFYQQLLQFLVALAVGTLCGDALLHLLPHAILGAEPSPSSSSDPHAQHGAAVWRGLAAGLGVVFFFLTEKALTLVAEWRNRRQRRQRPAAGGHQHRVRVMREPATATGPGAAAGQHSGSTPAANGGSGGAASGAEVGVPLPAGGKQCKHKYSSYPYCYGEIQDAAEGPGEAERLTGGGRRSLPPEPAPCCLEELKSSAGGGGGGGGGGGDASGDGGDGPAGDLHPAECESYTVIIREHESAHHGHSHAHGHVHAAPRSMSSVAWMVVLGDGLHNLTDGVAIGAAFAAGLPGGFSTALAVLCHELPHELGDFAVLLRAGMSLRQAAFYNVLSSLLCLVGMLFGVALGHSPAATPWVFGAAAGMFLYIALVDMVPELSSAHSQEGGSLCQCLLQVLGMLTGTGVMLLIALYEHDLKTVFADATHSPHHRHHHHHRH